MQNKIWTRIITTKTSNGGYEHRIQNITDNPLSLPQKYLRRVKDYHERMYDNIEGKRLETKVIIITKDKK
ncbi:hypothetical protein DRN69_00660 [Candidatus Pacearchaeota archaeon]|nr:MAG: hypothetical protein DRN69_00660 [Candidatus Pacearchaeota archaeon]